MRKEIIMINRRLLSVVGVIILIIAVYLVLVYARPNPETNSSAGTGISGEFYMKPAQYTLPPGGMIAVLLTVMNDYEGERDLYYNFNIKAVQTDTGKSLEEISKWVLFERDTILVAPNETLFKDSVVSVPPDASGGEYIFNAYACYGESAEELGECRGNSQNLWSSPLRLTIRVTG